MASRQRRPNSAQSSAPILPQVPATVKTPDGREYDIAGDVWFFPLGPGHAPYVKIDWTLLTDVFVAGTATPVMSSRAVSFAKLYTSERLGAARDILKPQSARDYLSAMLRFARYLATHPEWLPAGRGFDWSDLTAEMFDAWLATAYRTKRKGDDASLVRRFYLWGAGTDAGRTEFSPALASVLSALCIRRHAEGELVESRDKRRGPFNRDELELIFNACVNGAGKDQDRAIAWTLLETAIRPKQMYLLTNQDLEVTGGLVEEGSVNANPTRATYRLRVRKIKQRNNVIKYHFLPLSEGCAQLLLDLCRPESGPDAPLFWWVSRWHNFYILKSLRAFAKDADLRSPRLPIKNPEPGGPIHERLNVSPRRFRYGVATDRIARGETPEDVAEMLGHKDTQTLRAYVETSPLIADDFQRATDYVIVPLVAILEGRSNSSEVNLLKDYPPLISSQLRSYSSAAVFTVRGAPCLYRQNQRGRRPTDPPDYITSWLDNSEARIKKLVESARRRFPQIYPGQDFGGQTWNVAHLQERPKAIGITRIGFTTQDSKIGKFFSLRPEDALPAYFSDVIKSWLVIPTHVSLTSIVGRLNAARHFWNFLSARLGEEATSFRWGELTEDDILAFEQFLMTYRSKQGKCLKHTSIFQFVSRILGLLEFLASWGICRSIDYVPQTRPTSPVTTPSLDEKRLMAERKLPSPGVIETLAGIYYRLTTAPEGEVSDWILIIISAVAILMLTGLRIGELITLPVDCEVEDKCLNGQGYSYRYGIRYWVEKTGKKSMRVRWISPTAEPVVRAAVARITRLTATARERARVLEANPDRVMLPQEVADRTVLARSEVLALLGLKSDVPIRTTPPGILPQHGRGSKSYFYVGDLEAYLLSKRAPQLYTVRHDDGTFQMFSESLFVVFAKQSRQGKSGPCFLLVESINAHAFSASLSSPTSLFKSYGESIWQRESSANLHSLRHWLIHVAYKGGLETHLLLRYFAKRYVSSITEYLHFTTDESDPYAPDELSAGQFYVPA